MPKTFLEKLGKFTFVCIRIPLKGDPLSPSVDVFSLARRSKSSERRPFKEGDPLRVGKDA